MTRFMGSQNVNVKTLHGHKWHNVLLTSASNRAWRDAWCRSGHSALVAKVSPYILLH